MKNETEQRWLEIMFYCFCKSIFNKTQKIEYLEDFIYGFRWTKMFDYDKLIKAIKEENILFNTNFIPKEREFIIVMDSDIRYKAETKYIYKFVKLIGINYSRAHRYRVLLQEEERPTEVFPKLRTRGIHKEIYNFLKAIKQFGDYTSGMKL